MPVESMSTFKSPSHFISPCSLSSVKHWDIKTFMYY